MSTNYTFGTTTITLDTITNYSIVRDIEATDWEDCEFENSYRAIEFAEAAIAGHLTDDDYQMWAADMWVLEGRCGYIEVERVSDILSDLPELEQKYIINSLNGIEPHDTEDTLHDMLTEIAEKVTWYDKQEFTDIINNTEATVAVFNDDEEKVFAIVDVTEEEQEEYFDEVISSEEVIAREVLDAAQYFESEYYSGEDTLDNNELTQLFQFIYNNGGADWDTIQRYVLDAIAIKNFKRHPGQSIFTLVISDKASIESEENTNPDNEDWYEAVIYYTDSNVVAAYHHW